MYTYIEYNKHKHITRLNRISYNLIRSNILDVTFKIVRNVKRNSAKITFDFAMRTLVLLP